MPLQAAMKRKRMMNAQSQGQAQGQAQGQMSPDGFLGQNYTPNNQSETMGGGKGLQQILGGGLLGAGLGGGTGTGGAVGAIAGVGVPMLMQYLNKSGVFAK